MAKSTRKGKAYVLIETAPGKTRSVKTALSRLTGGASTMVHFDAITGPYDFIAVEGPSLDAIGRLVTDEMGTIDGVTRTPPAWPSPSPDPPAVPADPLRILVYDSSDADRYAGLIRAPRSRVAVSTARHPGRSGRAHRHHRGALRVETARRAVARAPRLRWPQAMGAGVDWALVPELPRGVTVTRAPGVFGPWMAEYVIGWCLWVTQHMDAYRRAQSFFLFAVRRREGRRASGDSARTRPAASGSSTSRPSGWPARPWRWSGSATSAGWWRARPAPWACG
jgi:hypothetical protein